MTDNTKAGFTQLSLAETEALAEMVRGYHEIERVLDGPEADTLRCSCGQVFDVSPVDGIATTARAEFEHLKAAMVERASAAGEVIDPAWPMDVPFTSEAPGPIPVPDTGIVERTRAALLANQFALGTRWPHSEENHHLIIKALNQFSIGAPVYVIPTDAVRVLVADLAALLKADSFPVHVGASVLARADAFLRHGDEDLREVDPGPCVGDALDLTLESEGMNENLWSILQEVLYGINELPGVRHSIECYMRGRGTEDPSAEIEALHKVAF